MHRSRGLNQRGKKLMGMVCVLVGVEMLSANVAVASTKPKQKGPSQEEYYSTMDPNVSFEDRRKANDLRVKTIDSISSLLKQKNVKGSRRFELLLRLGELHAEMHDYVRDQEMSDYSSRYEAWEKKGKKGKAPTLSNRKSKTQLALAAESFRTLVREFPKHPRTAAALYSLGKTLARLQDDGAVMYFARLIKNHRSSPLVPDAYLSMGELYFEKHNIAKAMDAYKSFLKYKSHPAYPYGVYKLGWSFYNATPANETVAAKNVDKAIDSFKLVIKLADADQKSGKMRINLRSEAIKDLVMVWSETEDTKTAWAYFKTIGEKDSFYDLLDRLGNIYSDQGKNAKAAEVFAKLASEAPTRDNVPRIQEKLLGLYNALTQYQKVVNTLDEMRDQYVKGGVWTNAHQRDQKLIAEIKDMVEFNMHRYGTLFHQRGQKTKSKNLLVASSQIYFSYLSAFPKEKNAYVIRYYLAELLFDFGKYESASDQYVAVVDANRKGKFLKDAAMNAVVAMNKLDQATKYSKLPPAGQVPKPLALPKTKSKLVDVLDKYVAVLPKESTGYPMRFTAAQIFFEYGQYSEATKRFEGIIDELPNSKQAEASVKILIAFQTERKDWEKTIVVGNKLLENKKLSKGLRTYIVQTMRTATYNQALELEKVGKFEDAARAFVAFQKDYGREKGVGDKALFNAANNFYKASMLEDALAISDKLVKSYPDSSLVPEAITNVAQTYEALAQYEKAAQYYREYAMRFPKEKLASRALYNAAVLYQGLNNLSEAERLMGRFVQHYPYNSMVHDVHLELARAYEKENKNKSALETYKRIASGKNREPADVTLLASAKAALLTLELGNSKEGRRLMQSVASRLKAKGAPAALDARRILAEAMFKEVEASFASYKQISFSNARGIEGDVKKKQQRLEYLAKRYEEVIALENQEYVVASLFRLGEMHEDFSEKLLGVSAPSGASQVEISQFKSSIEKVAFPLRDEAYKFYETAFKRSQEVETFTVWTRRTYDKMAQLAPEKNPEVYEQSADPGYMAHHVSMEPAVAVLAH